MIERYGKIYSSEWQQLALLDDRGKLLVVFLRTGPHATAISGVSVAGPASIAEDLGWEGSGTVRAVVADVVRAGYRLDADIDRRVYVFPQALELDPPESPAQLVTWSRAWPMIANCDAKARLRERLRVAYEPHAGGLVNKKTPLAPFDSLFAPCETPAQGSTKTSSSGARDQEQVQVQVQVQEHLRTSTRRRAVARRGATGGESSGFNPTKAAFSARYQAEYGHPFTWNSKSLGQLKQLVRQHDAAEIERRIGILFDGQGPAYLQPPFDLGTLVAAFNKLVQPTARQRIASAPAMQDHDTSAVDPRDVQ